MNQSELIVKALQGHKVSTVLDLWAGRGQDSLLCASYGCKVDAVDANKMKLWQFPSHLKQHPNISFHEKMIHEYLQENTKKYDLIMMFNAINFLKPEYVQGKLFELLSNMLNEKGTIVMNYFRKEDETMKDTNLYDEEELAVIDKYCSIEYSKYEVVDDQHPPMWFHQHHIQYLMLRKL